MKLLTYIDKHHAGNRSEFARSQGVTRQQVNKWLKQDYLITNGLLVKPMRTIKMDKYENTLDGVYVENDSLIKNGQVMLSVGDSFIDRLNPYRSYKCEEIDLHFISFSKTSVGQFETEQLGKSQEYQTVHFLENELNLMPVAK